MLFAHSITHGQQKLNYLIKAMIIAVSSYVSWCPVRRTVQSAVCFATDLFISMPTQLLWEISRHAAILLGLDRATGSLCNCFSVGD